MRRLPIALALLCTFSTPAWADFRADFDAGRGANDNALSRIELSGQHLRTDAGNVSMLFDARNGKMIVLMHDKHQYMDIDKIADTVGAAMSQANAALASLPPEQRAMIERQLGGRMPGAGAAKTTVHMTPTGVRDRVAGIACQSYRTEIDGRNAHESCLANVGDAGISGADQTTLRNAFEQMRAMGEKMSGGMMRSPLSDMPIDKFPVRLTRLDDSGKPIQISQLKAVTSGPIDPNDFAIPSGYSEANLRDMGRSH